VYVNDVLACWCLKVERVVWCGVSQLAHSAHGCVRN